jgi:asparagine synthase (glutamine-hydrolysing)
LLDKKLPARYQGVRRVFSREMLGQLSRNGFPQEADSKYRQNELQGLFHRAKDNSELNQMLFVDLQAWLPDDLLVKADKMTMAASIELRVPFLDHVVVEFASRLPENMKIRDGQSKYLLKRLMRDRVPADILHAPKRGFPVPISQWLRGDLYEKARSWLLDSPLLRSHLVAERMERLLTMHRKGEADLSGEIYGLVCLSLWHEVFSASSRSASLAGMAKE